MKYVFFILIAALTVSCLNKADKEIDKVEEFNYSIDLNVSGLRGPVILLDRTTFEPVKTVYSRNESFKMEGTLPMDKMHATFVLHFPSKYSNPYFYPTSEACAINFWMDRETKIVANYDSLLFADVSNIHTNAVETFKDKYLPSVVEFDEFNMESLKVSERRSEKEQIAYASKGNALLEKVRNELLAKTGNFLSSEEMAVILAEWGGQLGVEKLDSLGDLLSPEVKESAAYARVIAISDYIKKQSTPPSLKVGDRAPMFSLPDEKGDLHELSGFKGKYLVIDFWASWCGPCKKEMPFMKELYHKYHEHGLEMLAISTDQERGEWIEAINKLNMPYLQLHDNKHEAADSYFVKGIPCVLLLNHEGTIVAIERGEALEEKIKEVLNINS